MTKKRNNSQRKSGVRSAAAAGTASLGKGRRILYTIAALLALVGLADATYLTASHLAGETVTCFGVAGCSDVLGSSYAKVGPVPLAAFGVLAYLLAFGAAICAGFGMARAHTVLLVAVGAMFLTTLWLLYVQAFVLHAFCSYCLLSAALTFALAGIAIVVPPPNRAK
jgi:uncharacterized membrane protein